MHELPKQQVKYLHARVQGCGVTYILKEFSLARIMSDAELASTLCDSVWVVVSCQSVGSHPYKWAKESGPFACSHAAEISICPSSKRPSKYTWRAMSTTKGFTSRWGSHKKHIEWVFWIKHVHHLGQKQQQGGIFFVGSNVSDVIHGILTQLWQNIVHEEVEIQEISLKGNCRTLKSPCIQSLISPTRCYK